MTRNKKNLIVPSIDAMCEELGFKKKKYDRYDRPFNEDFTDRLKFSYNYFGSKDYVYVGLDYCVNNLRLMELYKRLWDFEGDLIPSMISNISWRGSNPREYFWGVSKDADVNSVITGIRHNIISQGYKFFDEFHDWNYLCEKIIQGLVPCNDRLGYGACALYLRDGKIKAIEYYEEGIKRAREKFEKLGRKLREEEYQPFRDNLKKLP